MNNKLEPIRYTKEELSLSDNIILNDRQLNVMLKRTPPRFVRERPAKGGGKWYFVSVGYINKVLNLMFGFDWDFEVAEYKFDLNIGQVFVLGKLTVKTQGKTITKMQFGRADIKFKKATQMPLDIGNDLKAATSDALKKCASILGVASDIYSSEEFREIEVVPSEKPLNSRDQNKQDNVNLMIENLGEIATITELEKVRHLYEKACLMKFYNEREKEIQAHKQGQ